MRMKFNTVLCVTAVILLNITGFLCQLDVCGQAPLNTRIAGGQVAREGAWPWQVSIYATKSLNNVQYCGGTLINKDWVLTAAQCVKSILANNIIIYLGHMNLTGAPGPNEISRKVSQVITHRDYNEKTFDNDIALLKLSSSVNFTDYIRPVCLAATGSTFAAGTESWVTGWGTLIYEGIDLSQVLREVKVPIVSNSVCNKGHAGDVTNNMICAGQEGKGPCKGDGGGPLVSKKGSQWIQSGVMIFLRGCGNPKYPGVFTRVSQYQNWINSQISSNQPGFVLFSSGESSSISHILQHSSLLLSLFFLLKIV